MPILTTLGAACARAWGFTSGLVKDQYFSLTSLLLPGNGTNGAQNNTFLDSSTNNFTITRNGNTTQGTFSPFSQTGWGNYFDGSGDYLSVANNAALNLGSSNYTIECWFYAPSAPTANDGIFTKGNTTSTGSEAWSLEFVNSSGNIGFGVGAYNSFASYLLSSSTAATLNAWNHIAVVRNGTSHTMYLNGASVATATASYTVTSAGSLYLGTGWYAPSTRDFIGYISNARLVIGTAVYTAAFTPPTAPLTAITNTSLLTCQSNRFIDNSSNAFTITANGNTSVVAFSPFNPTAKWSAATYGGSGYFDGTGDWVNPSTTSANLALGAGDFTIEFWLYTSRGATRQFICDFRNDGSTGSISPATAPVLIWGDDGADNNGNWLRYVGISSGSVVANADLFGVTLSTLSNQWNHIAIVRSSGTVYGYLNGARKNSVADSTNYNVNCSVSVCAAFNGGANYLGNINGFRIVKGTAVYTGTTYTVPTAPLTAVSGTSLLLNFTNAGIYDATSKNDLETVGNAQISTTQSKWGGSSMYFDGTGDYLTSPNNPIFSFGTGDFTVEGWVYLGAAKAQVILDTRASGPSTAGIAFAIDASNNPYVFVNGTTLFTSSTALSLNTWTHLAFVKSSGTITLYINGTKPATGSGASATSLTDQACTVGTTIDYRDTSATYHFNGYIQDFRVSRYARYTANFTAPTAPFPQQ